MAYHSWKPNIELAPICPRCYSSNTKFCYYNNYSLTQPRYFCKGCRRYWTKGGTLRNVPVGGGCRKNRRGKSPRQANHPMSHGHFNYSHELPDSYRSNHAHQDGVSKKSDLAPTAEGSTIDLALIYTKFVNHSSELNSDPVVPEQRGVVMEESFNAMGGAWNSATNQTANQGLDRLGGGEIAETPFENQIYTEDGDFSIDSGCSELAPTFFSGGVDTGNDFILSDCSVAPTTCQGFQPALEDDVIHHQDLMLGDLCSLDQSYRF